MSKWSTVKRLRRPSRPPVDPYILLLLGTVGLAALLPVALLAALTAQQAFADGRTLVLDARAAGLAAAALALLLRAPFLVVVAAAVLVTAGENDLILRSETECIARHLPDARLVIVEGADHGSYIVENETMGELLLEFLRDRWK